MALLYKQKLYLTQLVDWYSWSNLSYRSRKPFTIATINYHYSYSI